MPNTKGTASYNRVAEMTRIVQQLKPIRSHEEVGKILGMSKQTVARIERQALRKLLFRVKEAFKA